MGRAHASWRAARVLPGAAASSKSATDAAFAVARTQARHRAGLAVLQLVAYELACRFDYACCENMDQFRREQHAITRNGQLKAGGERHEKDDRRTIDDRTTYVLGWSNDAKIAALTRQ